MLLNKGRHEFLAIKFESIIFLVLSLWKYLRGSSVSDVSHYLELGLELYDSNFGGLNNLNFNKFRYERHLRTTPKPFANDGF